LPRPSVRPSAASDREPAWRRSRDGPRSSAFGRGNRAPSRDGASWAGRSASSSRLCAILSRDPGSTTDPERHANAPAPVSAKVRLSSADDMRPHSGVSNELAGPQFAIQRGFRGRPAVSPSPAAGLVRILPGSIAESPCRRPSGGAILSGPSAPGRSRVQPPRARIVPRG
jgi:hypothetical protein